MSYNAQLIVTSLSFYAEDTDSKGMDCALKNDVRKQQKIFVYRTSSIPAPGAVQGIRQGLDARGDYNRPGHLRLNE